MIVIDVETSGVDPYKNSLLSIGAVEFERSENQFYGECRVWEGAHIDPEALLINGFTQVQVTDPKKKSDKDLLLDFLQWANGCSEKTIAGHNPSFDRDFLRVTAMRYHVNWPFAHRTIDLHSIAYFHALRRGIAPPQKNNHSDFSLDKILEYTGIPPEPKPHNGLMGAKLESEVFHRFFKGRPLFREWQSIPVVWESEMPKNP